MMVLDALRVHLALECIGLDADERMVRIPGPSPDELPRFYAAHFAGGHVAFCRFDVSAAVCSRWRTLPPDAIFGQPGAAITHLADEVPLEVIHAGYSYVVTPEPAPREYAQAQRLTAEHQASLAVLDPDLDPTTHRVFGVVRGSQVVAMCASTRENAEAAEAWVQTLPAFRGQGYARQATAAWAASVRTAGKLAFYSHRLENRASQALARSLGLTPYVEDIALG